MWPVALVAARQPFRSHTWATAIRVICGRDSGDPARTRRLGLPDSSKRSARKITRHAGQQPSLRIVRNLFAALDDSAGVSLTDADAVNPHLRAFLGRSAVLE